MSNNDKVMKKAMIIAEENGWDNYLEYLKLSEIGLRKKAIQASKDFAKEAKNWSFEKRKKFLLLLHDNSMSLNYILDVYLCIPTLIEWIQNEPENYLACRYMGIYSQGPDLTDCLNKNNLFQDVGHLAEFFFTKALELNSQDNISRNKLIDIYFDFLYYATHHLPDGYIGTVNEEISFLPNLNKLINELPESDQKNDLLRDYNYYKSLLDDYSEYLKSKESDFAKWCTDRNRNYQWVKSYYYY